MSVSFLSELLQKFGLDDENNRKQATTIWSTLDNLCSTNPIAYSQYITNQVQLMENQMKNPHLNNCITPDKGMAVKIKLADTDAVVRIRRFLYLNFCTHRHCRMPYDSSGADANMNSETIHIPLAISPIRDSVDRNGCLAYNVDIISNPWCIRKSSEDTTFLNNFVQLGIDAIKDEYQLPLTDFWNPLNCPYYNCVDGLLLEEVIPFPIINNKDKDFVLKTMNDPFTLVHFVGKQSLSFEVESRRLPTMTTKRDNKMLIQDISTDCFSGRLKMNSVEGATENVAIVDGSICHCCERGLVESNIDEHEGNKTISRVRVTQQKSNEKNQVSFKKGFLHHKEGLGFD